MDKSEKIRIDAIEKDQIMSKKNREKKKDNISQTKKTD
jgi:hypothetical protein